ncbi:60Kd inner membrane protein-domain-containing protein [Lipomyces oligophaga]|uniref:60Kd inner membrane protein-domain-containing protein n=1 Tax=Lipomyces oligophaga TaxID=45792 RepID=UPI0034CD8303
MVLRLVLRDTLSHSWSSSATASCLRRSTSLKYSVGSSHGLLSFSSLKKTTLPMHAIGFLGVRNESTVVEGATNAVDSTTMSAAVSAVAETAADKIGYFESIGLAQSWVWPTDLCLHALEYAHHYTGLPWWATIVVVGGAVRLMLVPIIFKSFEQNMRMKVIRPQLNRMQEEVRSTTDPRQRLLVQRRISKYMKLNGVKMYQTFVGPLLQLPVAYGFFMSISKLAEVPIDGFLTGGALWFTNLAEPDPYLGLSAISALTMFTTFSMGGETGNMSSFSPRIQQIMKFGPALGMFAMGLYYSSANVLYFAVAGFISLFQAVFMRTAAFRKLMGISDELHMKSYVMSQQAQSSEKGIMDRYKEAWSSAQKQAEEKVNRAEAQGKKNTMPMPVKRLQK